MIAVKNYKFWFCTGSQDLYGDECLAHVAEHSGIIVDSLNKSGILPYEVVWKPTLITNELIRRTFNEANADEECAGVITWMHTFSPAKSWILGLQEYRKPLMHFHTQFNQEIPYDTIDMDFMNENQSAHGDREYGHMVTRMGIERKVIVGHWSDEKVVGRMDAHCCGHHGEQPCQGGKVCGQHEECGCHRRRQGGGPDEVWLGSGRLPGQ